MQIRLLRDMLEWGQGIRTGYEGAKGKQQPPGKAAQLLKGSLKASTEGEDIIIAVFPEGTLERLPNGTTVAKIIRDKAGPPFSM